MASEHDLSNSNFVKVYAQANSESHKTVQKVTRLMKERNVACKFLQRRGARPTIHGSENNDTRYEKKI